MLEASLADPTENALAQAWWASPRLRLELKPTQLRAPHAFEANAGALVRGEKWEDASKAAEKWLSDEPFSGDPAIQLSFILSVAFELHTEAITVLKAALRSNPDDLLLLNNFAFALGSLGRTARAQVLGRINLKGLPN